MRKITVSVLAGAVMGFVVAGPSAAEDASHKVVVVNHSVTRVGDFKTSGRYGSTLAGAIRAFGPPSSRRTRYGGNSCDVVWRRARITAAFANYGAGGSACDPAFGLVQRLTVKSPAWTTQKGLRIGARTSAILERHPTAVLRTGGWWLYSAYTNIGEGGDYAVVSAGIRNGRVTSFTMAIGAAGE